MSADRVLSHTPREFAIMMRSNVERKYDEYEDMAYNALMVRQAVNSKRLKKSDLFKRPEDEEAAERKIEELQAKSDHATEWMSQFKQFNENITN